MNRLLKLVFLCLLLCGLAIDAEAYVIDGIDYSGFGYDGTAKVARGQSTEATDIVIPEKVYHPDLGKEYTVTELSWGCFEGKTKLKSIKLPETITKFEGHSFYGCTSLTDINIPNSVVEIGANCFDSCSSLTSIELPASLEKIGSYAFDKCTGLTGIIVPDNVKEIEHNTFSDCSSLTSIELPDSLEVIGSYAFDKCTGLTEIIIPDNVKTIGYHLFADCTSLVGVVLGSGVETIGVGPFTGTTSLREVWIKSTTPPILDRWFFNTNIIGVTVYVPEGSLAAYQSAPIWKDCNLQAYGSHEFNEEVSYGELYYKYDKDSESYFVRAQNENESMNYQGLTDLIIPGKIIVAGTKYNVGGVMENAFAGSRLTSITFPSTFKTIPAGAFRNCKELTTVKLSGNISSIGNEAFAGCDRITTIDSSIPIPPVLGTDVFSTAVYENAKLSILKDYEEAYKNAEGWNKFYMLLFDVYEIQDGDLFYRLNSKELTGEVIPQSEYGSNYNKLFGTGKKVEIPETVSYKGYEFKINAIADGAFRESSIYNLVIPVTIAKIGDGAFTGSKIDYVDVPSLEYWYEMFPENNRPFLTTPGTLQINGEALTSVVITADPVVPAYAFTGCNGIISLEIGEGITNFEKWYSGMDNVTSLIIGADVTSLSAEAVNRMAYLHSVTSKNMSAPTLPKNAFDTKVYSSATLFVPAIGGSSYQTSDGWNAFIKKVYSDVSLASYPNLIFGADAGGKIIAKPANTKISGDIVIPSSINVQGNDYTISIAGDFNNCSKIESLGIPSTLRKIGTLQGCSSLKKIILPAQVGDNGVNPVDLFYYLFSLSTIFVANPNIDVYIDNELLKDLVIPNGYENVSTAFRGYKQLVSVTIPGSVTSIYSEAFMDCKNLTSMIVQNSRKGELYFGYNAIKGTNITNLYVDRGLSNANFSNLESLEFGNNISSIGQNMFSGTISLKSVTFPFSITEIGYYAFSGCTSLSEIKFAENGKNLVIGSNAFSGCTALGSIFFPAYITTIGSNAFADCSSLSEIKFAEDGEDLTISDNAFQNCSSLTSVSFPSYLSSIGSKIFSGCTSLSEVMFAENGKKLVVGSNAFSGCTALGSISFPAYITTIGPNAFADCSSLSEIKFAEGGPGVNIGEQAFKGTALKTIEIPGAVRSLGNGAFSNCSQLSEVAFAPGKPELRLGSGVFTQSPIKSFYYGRPSKIINTYNADPFSDTSESFDLTVEATVGPNLFRNAKLNKVTFGKGISEIGDMAFYGCTALRTLVIPASVETIGTSAFEKSNNISDIIFEDSQSKLVLGEKAFSFSNIENLYLGRTVESSNNTNGYGGVFSNNPKLKSVELGRHVTKIGNYEFLNCPNLYSLTVGVGVRDIEQYAIGCVYTPSGNLTSSFDPQNFVPNQIAKIIWLPNTRPQGYEYILGSVNYVSQSAYNLENQKDYRNLSSKFWVNGVLYVFNQQAANRTCVAIDCKYAPFMSDTSVPNEVEYEGVKITVQEINEYVFYNNSYIEKVEIGNNITKIGDYAFYGCEKLGSIFVPNSVKILGEWSFAKCIALESAIVGTGLTEIRTGCFAGDKKLGEFMVPSGVKTIGNQVFDGCKGLKRFEVMNRDTELYLGYSEKIVDTSDNPVAGKPLFVDAELEEVYIGGNISYSKTVEDGYSPFYRNDFLKKATISDRETEISDYEFYGCRNLVEVIVGNDVDKICDYAFSGCIELNEFSLGKKVATIGVDAFSDCGNMRKFTSYNPVPPICGSQALDDINVFKCTLYVPSSSVASYKAAEQWKNFLNRIEPITAVDKPVMSLSFDYSTLSMTQGEQQQIAATITPADASVPTLAWESDNVDVAMVSQFGNVVAIAPGSCYITATTTDGSNISETCFVTVSAPDGIFDVEISDIKVIRSGDTLKIAGASDNDKVTVVNLAGNVVYEGMNKTIERLAKGLYIIVVRDKVFKIIM